MCLCRWLRVRVCFHSERAIKVYIHRVSRYANGTHHTASTAPTGLLALWVRSALQENCNVENDVDAVEWFRLRGGRAKTPIQLCASVWSATPFFQLFLCIPIVYRVLDSRKTKTDMFIYNSPASLWREFVSGVFKERRQKLFIDGNEMWNVYENKNNQRIHQSELDQWTECTWDRT